MPSPRSAPRFVSDLVTNVVNNGLNERFDSVTDIAPLLALFPTFLNFRTCCSCKR
jgi:hypothetical protein